MVDMDPAAITDRLRHVAQLLREKGWSKKGVDLSSSAVSERLRTMGSLSDLCRRLMLVGQGPPASR